MCKITNIQLDKKIADLENEVQDQRKHIKELLCLIEELFKIMCENCDSLQKQINLLYSRDTNINESNSKRS